MMTQSAIATEPAAPAPLPENVVIIALEQIRPSKTNPRKHGRTPDPDFVESIRVHGVLQPIVVTVAEEEGFFDIVFGEMRWAGSKLAGRESIRAIVRAMEPDEIFELQILENSARKDVHPLDEADAFAELLKRGYTQQRIADRLGRPLAYVVQRLKLRELSKECRKALDESKVTLSVALLLARIPDDKLQSDALGDVLQGSYDGPMTAAEAGKLIEQNFMLRLDQAPFDIAAADLVPKAGPCTACPKRTGAQRELFADVKSPDLCTDPACHTSKVDALWKIKVKEAKAGGLEVLEGKAADKAVGYDGTFRDLTDSEYIGGKSKTVKQLLGKDLPPITLARDSRGTVRQLVKKSDLAKVLKQKAPAAANEDTEGDAIDKRRKNEERKLKLRRKAIQLAISAATQKAKKMAIADLLPLIVEAFAARAWNETQRAVLDSRGIASKAGNVEAQLTKLVRDANTNGDVAAIGLELAMRAFSPWHMHGNAGGGSGIWREALKLTGVDFAEAERHVIESSKANPGKKGKGSEPTGQDKGKPGVCQGCGCTDETPCVGKDGGECCEWVTPFLCSGCHKKARPPAVKPKAKAKAKGGKTRG